MFLSGKAFVRKWPNIGPSKKGVTMVIMLIDGDVDTLTDEALHRVTYLDHQWSLSQPQPTDAFKGMDASGIVREL